MKTINLKTLGTIAAVLFISSTTIQDTFAQRGRSGGGGGGSVGRSAPSRSSSPSISRGSMGNSGNRSAINRSSHRSVQRNDNRSVQNLNRSRVNPGISRRPGFNGRRPIYNRPGYNRPSYGYGYRRPFYNRFYNYYRPYLGFSLSVLPFGYYPFYFGQTQFFYSGGLYYRQYEREYKVVVPPVGAEVPNLPEHAQEVTINGQTLYEYKGVYYQPKQNNEGKTSYVITGKDGVLNTTDAIADDPNEAVRIGDEVQQLPEGSAEVTLKGAQYFVSPDGVYYEKVTTDNKVVYKVVGL